MCIDNFHHVISRYTYNVKRNIYTRTYKYTFIDL